MMCKPYGQADDMAAAAAGTLRHAPPTRSSFNKLRQIGSAASDASEVALADDRSAVGVLWYLMCAGRAHGRQRGGGVHAVTHG
jgi:hypothetical protein